MFELFTDIARSVVTLADEEARRFPHNIIGTEHILLGLLRAEEGAASLVLRKLGLTSDAARTAVVEARSPAGVAFAGHIPFTPRAEQTLRHAAAKLHDLRVDWPDADPSINLSLERVDTQQILIALMDMAADSPESGIAKVLAVLGVTHSNIRSMLMRVYNDTSLSNPEIQSYRDFFQGLRNVLQS